MTDRELMELAAKAAGLPLMKWWDEMETFVISGGERRGDWWNPLESDGDALPLAVVLLIQVRPEPQGRCTVQTLDGFIRTESGYESTGAATRRAIVRAAAEIGAAMKGEG